MKTKQTKGKWEAYKPTFEFTKDLPPKSSAWIGHFHFAYDLVANTRPKVIVEIILQNGRVNHS